VYGPLQLERKKLTNHISNDGFICNLMLENYYALCTFRDILVRTSLIFHRFCHYFGKIRDLWTNWSTDTAHSRSFLPSSGSLHNYQKFWQGPCHHSRQSPIPHSREQFMWDLWRTEWYWDWFFSECLVFSLSVLFNRSSVLLHNVTNWKRI